MRIPTAILIILILASSAGARNYYIDSDGGNDGNKGTSPAQAWASFDKASRFQFRPGDRILLQRGDVFHGKLKLDDDNGTRQQPILIGAYGNGDRPVIDAAGYLAGIHIISCDYIEIRDIEITGDGQEHIDGSNGKERFGINITNTGGGDSDGITIRNVYIHTIYPFTDTPHEGTNPTTYLGTAIQARGVEGNYSEGLLVENCHLENLGYRVLFLARQSNTRILNNLMENIGGPAMTPNGCDDLLVEGNTVDRSGAFTDPRMHGRGSGIWPINCNRVLIQRNTFMHARGRYDSSGVHLDHDNTDAIVQYNLSIDNEGGFVGILGGNKNCAYRYNISINDGGRTKGVNGGNDDGCVIKITGHNKPERIGPFNSYIYNNTIYVKKDMECRLRVDKHTGGLLVANNIFYVEGESVEGTPIWLRGLKPDQVKQIVWKNNLYQRRGIFPESFPFEDMQPIYGDPGFVKPGSLKAEDYQSRIKGSNAKGIKIPKIPGDDIGLRIGLEVEEDFFGNPIEGLPPMGAVQSR